MRTRHCTLLLLLSLLLGCGLRLVGLTRGTSDFVRAEPARAGVETAFYHFHPDEESVLQAALQPIDPLDPPLTVYGMLPVYLLRGVLNATAFLLSWGPLDLNDPDAARRIYYIARLLAVLFSVLTLGLVGLLGQRYFSLWTAALGVALVALAPGAIQQAHFYIVDGLFVLLSVAAMGAMLRALESGTPRWYLLGGGLIGLSAAVRLNGLLLVPVLLAGHLLKEGIASRYLDWKWWARQVQDTRLWLAGGMALLVLLMLQPILLVDWDRFWQLKSPMDFRFGMQVTQGVLLRSWTLADVHTLPYLHHWTHLWPRVAGWPLTLGLLAGVGYGLWRRTWSGSLMLVWCGLYFLLIGGWHAKHVRYLMPLLPFLALLAADAGVRLCRSATVGRRRLGVVLTAGVVLYTAVYGIAFARIYTLEDSRIQAARWMKQHLPAQSRIGVERGGFSLRPLIDPEHHRIRMLDTILLFQARGYMTCQGALAYLRACLLDLDYIAIADANRYRQFTAVPDLMPAAAGFYHRLIKGEMGFGLIQRFKHYPALGKLEFKDDGAETSFIGYDHPAILIFARQDQDAIEPALERWARDLETDPCCADRLLEETATALKTNDLERAQKTLQTTAERYPHMALAWLLQAEVDRRQGRPAIEAMARFQAEQPDRVRYVPIWASGMSLTELGLPELAVSTLEEAGRPRRPPSPTVWDVANAYVLLANLMYRRDYLDAARQVYQLAADIRPSVPAYNRLAYIAFRAGKYEQAVEHWGRSLQVDEKQAGVHSNVGQVAARYLHEYSRALFHLERAVELEPGLEDELAKWIGGVEKKTEQDN